MSPSSIDQGRKCNWLMPLAAARQEPHRKSNYQIGHASRLDCLHEAMDRETEGQHAERPHSSDGVSAHTTRLAASKKTRTTFSEEILGL